MSAQRERAGFEVECPCCRATFVAVRPELPFRRATAASTAPVPPDVRTPPKNPATAVADCLHCGQEFRPARGTRLPRYCSRSCARRAALAAKHGFALSAR